MRLFRAHLIGTIIAAVLVAASASGCARARHALVTPATPEAPGESTAGALPPIESVERIPSSTPKQAVTAYLSAIPEAYLSLEVTVVAPFVTDRQEVREDSYIQLNRQEGKALEMALVSYRVLEAAEPSADASEAIVLTEEQWRWRYWDIRSRKPATAWAQTTYRMEYSLAREGSGWLVAGSKIVAQSGDTSPTPLP